MGENVPACLRLFQSLLLKVREKENHPKMQFTGYPRAFLGSSRPQLFVHYSSAPFKALCMILNTKNHCIKSYQISLCVPSMNPDPLGMSKQRFPLDEAYASAPQTWRAGLSLASLIRSAVEQVPEPSLGFSTLVWWKVNGKWNFEAAGIGVSGW